jgi:Sortase domain
VDDHSVPDVGPTALVSPLDRYWCRLSRWWPAVALVVSVGCGGPPEPLPAATTTAVTTAPPTTPAQATTTNLARADPVELRIPRINARSSLVPLGLNADGTVEVPPVTQPMQAGWYRYAPTPGEVGPAIILGHVDGNKKPGIFYRLHELTTGDQITVSRTDGVAVTFVVLRVEQIPKQHFPTEAVYGDTNRPELRLITCGGDFDRTTHNYRDSIIVYAAMP